MHAIAKATKQIKIPRAIFFSESIETTDRPKTATIICSGGPTRIAISASKGAQISNAIDDSKPPKEEAKVTMPSA